VTKKPRHSRVASLLGLLVVSASLCAALPGCSITSGALPMTSQLLSIPSMSGPNTNSAAFKKKVENDPFPTGNHSDAE